MTELVEPLACGPQLVAESVVLQSSANLTQGCQALSQWFFNFLSNLQSPINLPLNGQVVSYELLVNQAKIA